VKETEPSKAKRLAYYRSWKEVEWTELCIMFSLVMKRRFILTTVWTATTVVNIYMSSKDYPCILKETGLCVSSASGGTPSLSGCSWRGHIPGLS